MDRVELANDIAPMLAVVASRKKDNLISYGELVRLLKALRPDEYEDLRPGSDVLGGRSGDRLGSFSGDSWFRAVESSRERDDPHPRSRVLRDGR